MPLASDLLAQAQHLADLDPTRPTQANLRRSVSASYYALFHLWLAEGSERVSPKTPSALAPRIARALSHGEMKEACLRIAGPNPGTVFSELVPNGFSPRLLRTAKAFVELQAARHLADYDLSVAFTRAEAVDLLTLARDAFDDWGAIRATDEANVFLCALIFGKRWSR